MSSATTSWLKQAMISVKFSLSATHIIFCTNWPCLLQQVLSSSCAWLTMVLILEFPCMSILQLQTNNHCFICRPWISWTKLFKSRQSLNWSLWQLNYFHLWHAGMQHCLHSFLEQSVLTSLGAGQLSRFSIVILDSSCTCQTQVYKHSKPG